MEGEHKIQFNWEISSFKKWQEQICIISSIFTEKHSKTNWLIEFYPNGRGLGNNDAFVRFSLQSPMYTDWFEANGKIDAIMEDGKMIVRSELKDLQITNKSHRSQIFWLGKSEQLYDHKLAGYITFKCELHVNVFCKNLALSPPPSTEMQKFRSETIVRRNTVTLSFDCDTKHPVSKRSLTKSYNVFGNDRVNWFIESTGDKYLTLNRQTEYKDEQKLDSKINNKKTYCCYDVFNVLNKRTFLVGITNLFSLRNGYVFLPIPYTPFATYKCIVYQLDISNGLPIEVTAAVPQMQKVPNLEYMFNNEAFSDIKFAFVNDDRTLFGHKVILTAHSNVLNEYFTKTNPECQALTMSQSYDAMNQLLKFIYTGELPSDEDGMPLGLIGAAFELEVMALCDFYEKRIIERITIENAPKWYSLAVQWLAENLQKSLLQYMKVHKLMF